MPEAQHGSIFADGARDAGIDAGVLDRLLSPMDAESRETILELCVRDLDTTRRNAIEAVGNWDAKALARHLHVMGSLAQTIGAGELANEALGMQARLRSGEETGYDQSAHRLNDLAGRAVRFLAEVRSE